MAHALTPNFLCLPLSCPIHPAISILLSDSLIFVAASYTGLTSDRLSPRSLPQGRTTLPSSFKVRGASPTPPSRPMMPPLPSSITFVFQLTPQNERSCWCPHHCDRHLSQVYSLPGLPREGVVSTMQSSAASLPLVNSGFLHGHHQLSTSGSDF